MTKKHFIELADAIRDNNSTAKQCSLYTEFSATQLNILAAFCQKQNSQFNRERWMSYVKGECGPNGGTPKWRHAQIQQELSKHT